MKWYNPINKRAIKLVALRIRCTMVESSKNNMRMQEAIRKMMREGIEKARQLDKCEYNTYSMGIMI